jgi:GT2 family glycosyltransferase
MESPRAGTAPSAPADVDTDGIAIVVLTHNREHLVRKCVENVLQRVSDATREIVIWDNASSDGTAAFLASVDDPRIRVVRSEKNIGQNAYAEAFNRTTAPYLIEIDDDVTNAPAEWDRQLRDAFVKLPEVGFLAADLEDDPNDEATRVRHHERPHEYRLVEENGVRLLRGPTGGGCAMTSRELNQRAGGFRQRSDEIFWLEDAAYIEDISKLGYSAAVLADLRVHHTGGPYYSTITKEKEEYWKRHWARRRRREAAKRVLVRVPFVRRLNARHGWFVAPDAQDTDN